MPLASGTRIGPYEIVAPLGAGGMGEVYRARDTNLGRDVALKALPDRVAHDPERLARFRREAQVLAALNHPHIGSIYGLEESSDQRVLVLELVEGETLAERLRRGPLPEEEATAIAREIAEALQAAHDRGIVHRDLKPANIALTGDDRVKVLDFGLAKATDVAVAPGGADPLDSPTVTSPARLTGLGVVLGTAAYMSPEQARGRAADKRSDIWAFGCVLFEMLTGQRAFRGEEVHDTLAAVLGSEPDWNALPPSLARAVRTLLEGCLEKNPRERVGDISAALFVLHRLSGSPRGVRSPGAAPGSYLRWALFALAAAAVAGAVAIGFWPRAEPARPEVARFRIAVPENPPLPLTLSRSAVAVSPDGTRIVYVADGRLYVRALAEDESRPIPGADPGIHPAFSPDGRELVFWSDPALKRIGVTGGTPLTICETTPAPFSLDWNDSGIVFAQPGGIQRVSSRGGTPSVLVPMPGALVHGARMLPDGETLLFAFVPLSEGTAPNFWDQGRIVAQSLRTGRRTTLVEGGSDARYVPSGHLVYMIEGTLMAVRFDLGRLTVAGEAVPVVEGVRRASAALSGSAHYAVSNTGVLVYVPGSPRLGEDDVFLFDRTGAATPLKLPRGPYAWPRVSPDGTWLALETNDGRQAAISVYELSGASSLRRLTFEGNNRLPIWSRDGTRVAFQSDRDGDYALFWQSVTGGAAERLTRPEPGVTHVPEAWSPQDDVFLFSATKGSETTLWTFSLADRKASRFADVTSSGVPTNAVFSPDGRWVAYQSGTGSIAEATPYVQPFPPTGQKFEIARRGGRLLWSRDMKELFYIPAPAQFAAVTVRTEPTFALSPPVAVPRRFGLAPPASPRPFDILPDGRFVAVDAATNAGDREAGQIHVVLNWFEELRRMVPR